MTWRNWARSQRATPTAVLRPEDADEVAGIVRAAHERGARVKPVGAGHSFSAVAVAPGIQLDLARLSGLLAVDAARREATFAAGTPLHAIGDLLAPHGLALESMGDIDRQTLAGAVSTGTHGTGLAFGSIGSTIVAATLVTGTGEVLRVSGSEHPELLPAVRLGLGALGVLVDVTLRCSPAFTLHAVERVEPLEAVLEAWRERAAGGDHVEWYWFHGTDVAITMTRTRGPADAPPMGPGVVRRVVEREVLANGAWGVLCAAAAAVPSLAPGLARVASTQFAGPEVRDRSDRVFVAPRRVRFREMEYGMPLDAVPSAFRAMRALVERRGWRITFPVEVRAVAGDDALLSTAHGRETGYVAVHRYWREDPREHFAEVERVLVDHGGRPHWGKLHTRTAADLEPALPTLAAFRAVRDRLDPDRTFDNPYLRRTIG
ncbi:D-arabinono-1,4-lactone oxidase [Agrococcus sp. SGAir0287]|uniref:D-arabinono-1,4-lactone oxidase n=1 Tax=Agrococcus sp. SGAir0287 TaxID=2070347 RepID=UPI0010CCE2D7|nr:D-arabinono-1,4-lactone oxidase [Agrococcus sp. SGAir0287]QCR18727.1 FAD-linked oxidoreductase [Agrococcus sp. SGAir0287]